jgi:hypothetical protein
MVLMHCGLNAEIPKFWKCEKEKEKEKEMRTAIT